MPEYDDIRDGVFEFESYGKCVFKSNIERDKGSRTDIISYNNDMDKYKLKVDIHIGNQAIKYTREMIISIIKNYWDCICKKGCHRHIIGYEFAVDTGTHTPVCCRKPVYGFHESKIIIKITKLLDNSWIKKCSSS